MDNIIISISNKTEKLENISIEIDDSNDMSTFIEKLKEAKQKSNEILTNLVLQEKLKSQSTEIQNYSKESDNELSEEVSAKKLKVDELSNKT